MYKKILSIFLSGIIFSTLSACSVDENYSLSNREDSETNSATTERISDSDDTIDNTSETVTEPENTVSSTTADSASTEMDDQQIPAVDNPEIDYDFWIMQDGVSYLGLFRDPNRDTTAYEVRISDISLTDVTFNVMYSGVNGSPFYETGDITVPVTLLDNPGYAAITNEFAWTDSWGNQGIGVMQMGNLGLVEGPNIQITMTVTASADWNRATLATNGPLILSYVPGG